MCTDINWAASNAHTAHSTKFNDYAFGFWLCTPHNLKWVSINPLISRQVCITSKCKRNSNSNTNNLHMISYSFAISSEITPTTFYDILLVCNLKWKLLSDRFVFKSQINHCFWHFLFVLRYFVFVYLWHESRNKRS